MKPKDLQLTRAEDHKGPFFDSDQKIFWVPRRSPKAELDPAFKALFESEKKIHLEYCSGNGEWICNKAIQNPETIFIALEMRFDRVRKIWSKMKNRGIENLWIFWGEAFEISTQYIPPQSLNEISINFPDPWPKRKHAKNRLVQTPFIDLLSGLLKPLGILNMITDDPDYFVQMRDCLLNHPNFISLFPKPYYSSAIENYGASYFLELWMKKNRSFYFSKFQNSVHIEN